MIYINISLRYFEFDSCVPKFGNISSLKDMIRLKIYKNINILSLKLQEGIWRRKQYKRKTYIGSSIARCKENYLNHS